MASVLYGPMNDFRGGVVQGVPHGADRGGESFQDKGFGEPDRSVLAVGVVHHPWWYRLGVLVGAGFAADHFAVPGGAAGAGVVDVASGEVCPGRLVLDADGVTAEVDGLDEGRAGVSERIRPLDGHSTHRCSQSAPADSGHAGHYPTARTP